MKPLPSVLRSIFAVVATCSVVAIVALSCGPGQLRVPLVGDPDGATGDETGLDASGAPAAANGETVLRLSMPWTDASLSTLKASDVRVAVFGGAQNNLGSLSPWTTDASTVTGGSAVSNDGQFVVDLTLSSLEEWLKRQGTQICLRLELQRRSDGRPVATTPVSCIDR